MIKQISEVAVPASTAAISRSVKVKSLLET